MQTDWLDLNDADVQLTDEDLELLSILDEEGF